MEGPRLPPQPYAAADEDKPDDPPSSAVHRPSASLPDLPSASATPSPSHWRKHSLNFSPSLTPPRPPPPEPIPEVETYVVQVPRDQVYWVPPPEHAKIAERRRKPEKAKKGGCCKRLAWFLFVLIVLGIIAGVIALVVNFVFRPVPPLFTIENFAVKTQKSRILSFDITLRAENPTSNMGVDYMQSAGVSISYKNKNLGRGRFPKLSQSASGSDKVRLKLDGSKNASLPPESKQPVKLVLTADLDAKYGVGPLKRNKGVTVTCYVKVKGLDAKKVQIVSENCESEFIVIKKK
ncbi:PREDICTED: uncharacterized protein LOC104807704 isoform X2 [Tarenaya hassleriana]|uniref:uncharacterized protein LOC104807704 isoform X2 n=1 Tax=Tarenaya hassleriana TaxID=28532 RepID=UPI00053C7F76|nr:PREDICTED: uncharacterized protein LOC104807704 isoform X2 [Tarenaya hassleriana]